MSCTCKNQPKKNQQNNIRVHGKKIDNISLALMKQLNLFPVAMGMLIITHDQNIYGIHGIHLYELINLTTFLA